MASKTKTCDFCGKRGNKSEMIQYEDKLFCDDLCVQLWREAFEDEENKKD